jgi:hypothetical protein
MTKPRGRAPGSTLDLSVHAQGADNEIATGQLGLQSRYVQPWGQQEQPVA